MVINLAAGFRPAHICSIKAIQNRSPKQIAYGFASFTLQQETVLAILYAN